MTIRLGLRILVGPGLVASCCAAMSLACGQIQVLPTEGGVADTRPGDAGQTEPADDAAGERNANIPCGHEGQPCCIGADSSPGCVQSTCWDGICAKQCVVSIAATSTTHACALRSDGVLFCWGNNGFGQLGVGDAGPDTSAPQQVPLPDVTGVAVSDATTFAVTRDGGVWSWGSDNRGVLGIGGLDGGYGRGEPGLVPGLRNAVAVAAGLYTACAIESDGSLWCWGENAVGQLGDGTEIQRSSPVRTGGGLTARSVSVGAGYACAIRDDGTGACWGQNPLGNLGTGGGATWVPAPIGSALVLNEIVANETSCAINPPTTLVGWGRNDYGQLGLGTKGNLNLPTIVRTDVLHVALSDYRVYTLRKDRSVWWSGNDGMGNSWSTPIQVAGLPPIVGIAAGGGPTYAIDVHGQVWMFNPDMPPSIRPIPCPP